MAVLLYHADLAWIPGGFLGVEVFFVISGYLITALLARGVAPRGQHRPQGLLAAARQEAPARALRAARGHAGLRRSLLTGRGGRAAGRRARRLRIRDQLVLDLRPGVLLRGGRTAFAATAPWSLAVEEQFYLIWPIVLAVGLGIGATRLRRRRVLIVALAGAAASAVAMALLYAPGVDPSRIYYGTDTRATGLLVGAALAFLWSPGDRYRPPETRHRRLRLPDRGRFRRRWGWTAPLLLDIVGLGALGALIWFSLNLGEFEPFLYKGGFALVALATAAAIMAVVHPFTHIGSRVLGSAPLRWLGVRSYGIYLWHWPVFMVTRPELDVPFGGLPLLALRLDRDDRARRPLVPLRRDAHTPRRPGTRLEDAPRGAGTAAPATPPAVGRRRRAHPGLFGAPRRGRGPRQATRKTLLSRLHEGGPYRRTTQARAWIGQETRRRRTPADRGTATSAKRRRTPLGRCQRERPRAARAPDLPRTPAPSAPSATL